jgi:hypothetical protein
MVAIGGSVTSPGGESMPAVLARKLCDLGLDPHTARVDDYALRIGDIGRAFTPDVVVEVALTERGLADLRLERQARQWAADRGIRTPAVLEYGPTWMAGEVWPTGPATGAVFVAEAVRAADHISAEPAPDWMCAGPGRWRAPARGRLRRVVRLAQSGVPLAEFARARRVAADLPLTVTAHGDYHPGNLLFDTASGQLAVIDWTHAGPAPRYTDLLRLWGQAPSDEDSEALASTVLATVTDDERVGVGALWHWLALRQLAEYLTQSTTSGDADYPARVWRRLRLARSFARSLGSPTVG